VDDGRRAEIAEAAAQLFRVRGYHATTVRQLAQALDLQGGSLYAHIASKEDVLAAIVDRAADRFQTAIAAVEGSQAPAAARLRAAIHAHIGVVADDLAAATVYFQDWRHLSAPQMERIRERRDAYEAVWREIVASGVASGQFRSVDPALAAVLCLSGCNWLYQWFRTDGALDPAAVADAFADMLLDGLAAPDADDEEE
jgi:AcrR family transcriptional regulator